MLSDWFERVILSTVVLSALGSAVYAQESAIADSSTAAASDPRSAVVQISSTLRLPNYMQPWNKRSTSVSGTGTLIAGGRVLTNAHVVSFASQIYIQQGAERVSATTLFMAPNIDLAVLQIEDEDFCAKRTAVEVSSELPGNGQAVKVYGYPIGGSDLSMTEGVVSRVEMAAMFNGTSALRIQVDAAVNPGNSGGPAFANGKMIGVVFSKSKRAESTGYLIAGEEVAAFLEDIADGTYDGRPQWMHSYQRLDNDALRAYYQLEPEVGGVLITKIHSMHADQSPLQVGDLLVRFNGQTIGKDGKSTVNETLRLPFPYFLPKSTKSGPVTLEIIRQGKPMSVEMTCETQLSRVIGFELEYPPYFLYGPLVFTVATRGMTTAFPSQVLSPLLNRASPLLTRTTDELEFPGEELVVIPSNPFSSPLMKGYNSPTLATLSAINGVSVKNLRHAAELLCACEDEFVRFEFADRGCDTMVFKRSEIEAATEAVLEDNSIRSQYSDDLREVFEKRK